MTESHTIIQQRIQETQQLRKALIPLTDALSERMKPALTYLRGAAGAESSDAFELVGGPSQADIDSGNKEVIARANLFHELFNYENRLSGVGFALKSLEVDEQLNNMQARGRIKTAARGIYDLTRPEAVLEACPTLNSMQAELPILADALANLAQHGEEAADALDNSALARAHMVNGASAAR